MLTHLGAWLFCKDSTATTEKRSRRQGNVNGEFHFVLRLWWWTKTEGIGFLCQGAEMRWWYFQKVFEKMTKLCHFWGWVGGFFRVGGCNLGFSHWKKSPIWHGVQPVYNPTNPMGIHFQKCWALSLGRCFSKAGFGYFLWRNFQLEKRGSFIMGI